MDVSRVVAALGAGTAGATAARTRFAVDMRQGQHWVSLAGFSTRGDATAAIARAVDAGAEEASLRIRRVRRARSGSGGMWDNF